MTSKGKRKELKFRNKLLLILFSCLILIVGLSLVSINAITQAYTKTDVIDNIKAKHVQLDTTLDSLISDANSVTISLFGEEVFFSVTGEADKDAAFQAIYDSSPAPSFLFHGVSYYVEEKEVFQAKNDDDSVLPPMPASVYEKVFEESTSSNPIVYCLSTYNQTGEYLILGKKIQISGKDPGVAFMYLNEDSIFSLLSNIVCAEKTFLIDSSQYIVASPTSSELGAIIFQTAEFGIEGEDKYITENFDGKKAFIASNSLTKINSSFNLSWKVVSIQDYNSLFSLISLEQLILVLVTALVFVIAIFIAFMVSASVSKPIKSLSKQVQNFNLNNINSDLSKTVEPSSEISQLENSYHQMVRRIDDLMEENIREMDEKRILELDSLQTQINPHFLYNTLDAIAWMAKINNQTEIGDTVISLAKFFRLSLHSGDKVIFIEEEVELTKHYLEIINVRFPDKFTVSFNVEPDLKSCHTLKLILQPLVENAVKYAFNDTAKKGKISINVFKSAKDVIMEVADDGEGFLVKGNTFEKRKETTAFQSGFGLYNVNERIRLEYGDNYGLTINSKIGEGTKVTVKIPLY